MEHDSDFLTRPRPWQRSATTGQCPVGLEERDWIERSMRWFVGQFGKAAAQGPIAVPGPDFYPDDYTGTRAQIQELVNRTCTVMGADPAAVILEYFDGADDARRKRAVGHFQRRDGRGVISLDESEADDPATITAIIAHELGHARLIGEGRSDGGEKQHERLTDLVTVYLGMGVFTANSALTFEKTAHGWSAEPLGGITEQMLAGSGHIGGSLYGYLKEPAYGYAMACLCGIRRETDPPWAAHLDPGPRQYLKQSLEYFARLAGAGEGSQ